MDTDQQTAAAAAFEPGETIDLAVDYAISIVSSYVRGNHVAAADLPALIASVHAAIVGLGRPQAPAAPEIERPTAAQIKKSITDAGLISFIDGRSYKTLKRHLTGHGLDPRGYRERFGLPADYPMVAPSYSAARSALAKANGLGVLGAQAAKPALAAVA